ncbi:MAG: hypothetical protein J5631_09915 [Spirochaetaceae bacterium]|nr:hypothetical protein [Spirochaetaceae bacterium]
MEVQYNLIEKLKSFFVINPLLITSTFITAVAFFTILGISNSESISVCIIACCIAFLIITCIDCIKSNKLKYILFFVILLALFLEDYLLPQKILPFDSSILFSFALIVIPPFSQLLYHIAPLKKKYVEKLSYESDSSFIENIIQLLTIVAIQLAVTLILTLLLSLIAYIFRDKALVEALYVSDQAYYFSFYEYMKKIFFTILPFSFFGTILFVKKDYLQNLNRFFIFTLISITIICAVTFPLYLVFEEFDVFDPLCYTMKSESFNPYNIPKLKEGMTKEEIINLIGEPVSEIKENFNHKNQILFTKCKVDDTNWYNLSVEFDEYGKASKIISYWSWGM